MATTPDAPFHDDSPPEIAALHREVSALMHRWQQAGVALHDVAMVLAHLRLSSPWACSR
jgi:hypothetical protein